MYEINQINSVFLNNWNDWPKIVAHPTLIICERKEDVHPVRKILAQYLTSETCFDQIQIATLDRLTKMISDAHQAYCHQSKSFLDSEDLIQIGHFSFRLLNLPLFDCDNLARQLVSFLSFPGSGKEFLDVFLKFWNFKTPLKMEDLSRKFLASYQFLRILMDQHQTIHHLTQTPDLFNQITLFAQQKVLIDQILWVKSPLYVYQDKNYQSGLQDPYLTEVFMNRLDRFRRSKMKEKAKALQCVLNKSESSFHTQIQQYPSWRDLFLDNLGQESEIFLGDIQLTELSQIVRWDQAYGRTYEKFSFSAFKSFEEELPSFDQNSLFETLSQQESYFLKILKIFKPHKAILKEIADQYRVQISPLDRTKLFEQLVELHDVRFSNPFLKPLHLYAKKPIQLISFGYPHTPKKASWRIEKFNRFFEYLEQQGARLFQPASPLPYLNFWSFLLKEGLLIKTVNLNQQVEDFYGLKPRRVQTTFSRSFDQPQVRPAPQSAKNQRLMKLGVRSFAVYLTCPKRFLLSEELKLSNFDSSFQLHDDLELGTLYHEVAHQIFLQKKNSLTDFDLDAFLHQMTSVSKNLFLFQSMKALLKNFIRSYHELIQDSLQLNETIKTEEKIEIACGSVWVQGRMDRLEENQHHYKVVDLKTTSSKNPKKIDRLTKSFSHLDLPTLQLLIYATLLSRLKKPQSISIEINSVSYLCLDQKIEKSTEKLSQEFCDRFWDKMLKASENLLQGDRSLQADPKVCKTCPYFQKQCVPNHE
jgi:RecB family exonuclease